MSTHSKRIRFGQINLAKRVDAVTELNKRNFDITLITEPQTANGKVTGLNNKSVVAASQGNPRACLTTNLPCWKHEELTCRDMAVAIVKPGTGTDLCVSSLYLDINLAVRFEGLRELTNFCKKGNLPLIVGMDSNAHSGLWGGADENKRGEELVEYLLELNLHVINEGNEYTYSKAGKNTIIDITVVNNKALSELQINDWKVDKTDSFSDHKYITFTGGKFEMKKQLFRNFEKANWELFKTSLEAETWPEVEIEKNLDDLAKIFQSKIKAALDIACPLKPSLGCKPNKW